MAGSKAGGKKTAKTNKNRYGKDYYKNIGRLGGVKSSNGGFASQKTGKDGLTGRERARVAGKKGGKASKRGKE